MLTVVQEHLVTAKGAVAKPDIVHPKLVHGERSKLFGPVAEPVREARARQATARRATIRRVFRLVLVLVDKCVGELS